MRCLPRDYQLVVAGNALDPEYSQMLRDQAADDARVRLILRQQNDQELADLLQACDCVALPYWRITGSGALLTALTMARGVVASDLSFFRSALAAEPDAGVLFRPGDAADLADAVKRFMAVPTAVRGAAARRVADSLAWDKVVRPVGEWLQAALPERLHVPAESDRTAAPLGQN